MSFNIYPTKEHPQVTIRNWILGISWVLVRPSLCWSSFCF